MEKEVVLEALKIVNKNSTKEKVDGAISLAAKLLGVSNDTIHDMLYA